MPWKVTWKVAGFDHLGEKTYDDRVTAVSHRDDIAGFEGVHSVTLEEVEEQDVDKESA